MKWISLSILLFCLCKHIDGNANAIEELIGSMKNSFSSLSSKRELWFENYSLLKKLTDGDQSKLVELLEVSNLAIGMVWQLYTSEVEAQKSFLPKLVLQQGLMHLPYQVSFPAPPQNKFHAEIVFQAEEQANFLVELVRDDASKILLMKVNLNDRSLELSDQDEEGEIVKRVSLEGNNFPPITPRQPFRINIQVADDCIFTSVWVGDLSMQTPMPLPQKHHWCTKNYSRANSFVINIRHDPDEESADQENNIEILSTTVYTGIIVQ